MFVSDPRVPLQQLELGLGVGARSFDEWARGWLHTVGSVTGEFTIDDLRLAAEADGVVPPHSSLYGRFMASAVRKRLITKTGEYVTSRIRSNNGRKVPVYRKGAA